MRPPRKTEGAQNGEVTALLEEGFRRRFGRPVRVIFGAEDRYLNPRVARNFAALFPNSALHLLDGAGHYVQVDQPQQVADLIVSD